MHGRRNACHTPEHGHAQGLPVSLKAEDYSPEESAVIATDGKELPFKISSLKCFRAFCRGGHNHSTVAEVIIADLGPWRGVWFAGLAIVHWLRQAVGSEYDH